MRQATWVRCLIRSTHQSGTPTDLRFFAFPSLEHACVIVSHFPRTNVLGAIGPSHRPFSVECIVAEIARVCLAGGPLESALSHLFVIDESAFENAFVVLLDLGLSLKLAIRKVALNHGAAWVDISAEAVDGSLLELARIVFSGRPSHHSLPVHLVIEPLSIVMACT